MTTATVRKMVARAGEVAKLELPIPSHMLRHACGYKLANDGTIRGLIWLTGRLMPDFKTIADFRRDNGKAIRQTCKEFVLLCQRLGLFEGGAVAIRRRQIQGG